MNRGGGGWKPPRKRLPAFQKRLGELAPGELRRNPGKARPTWQSKVAVPSKGYPKHDSVRVPHFHHGYVFVDPEEERAGASQSPYTNRAQIKS